MNYYPVTDGRTDGRTDRQTESDAYESTVQCAQVGSKIVWHLPIVSGENKINITHLLLLTEHVFQWSYIRDPVIIRRPGLLILTTETYININIHIVN